MLTVDEDKMPTKSISTEMIRLQSARSPRFFHKVWPRHNLVCGNVEMVFFFSAWNNEKFQ